MTDDGRSTGGIGCLGTVLGAVVVAGIVVLFLFVGVVALAVVAALVAVGLLVWAVDRALLALMPSRRERREAQSRAFLRQFGLVPPGGPGAPGAGPTPGDVIDTTATEWSDGPPPGRPDPLGPAGPGPD